MKSKISTRKLAAIGNIGIRGIRCLKIHGLENAAKVVLIVGGIEMDEITALWIAIMISNLVWALMSCHLIRELMKYESKT